MQSILVAASGNGELTLRTDMNDVRNLAGEPEDATAALKRILPWENYNCSVAGSSYNVARTLMLAGSSHVKLLITTGNDHWADIIDRTLREERIDASTLPWRDRTSLAFNVIAHGCQQTRTLSLNMKGDYLEDRIDRELPVIADEVQKARPRFRIGTGVQIADAKIILTMFGDVRTDDGSPIDSVNVLNPGVSLLAPGATADVEELRRSMLLQLLDSTDLLVLNQHEERQLYASLGISSITELRSLSSSSRFLEMLVTRDEHGARYYNHDSANVTINACKVDVVDPTGAGDCFLGYYISCLAKGYPKNDALCFAAAAAALKVGCLGGSCVPTFDETKKFLDSLPPDEKPLAVSC